MLRDFSTTLCLSVGRFDGAVQTVQVHVPALGAYAVDRALEFPYCPVKSAK